MDKPKKGSIEQRSFAGELRAGDDEDFALWGYAASFDVLSRNLGGFRERIARGAFVRSLKAGDDVKATFNHDKNIVLGRRGNGTLTVEEDSRGLKFRCQMNRDSQQHRDIYASIKRGDISQCSFAFTINGDAGEDWQPVSEQDDAGNIIAAIRTLKDVNLIDVSAVTYPAYSEKNATSVQARSADYAPVNADDFRAVALARLAKLDSEYTRMIDTQNLSAAVRIAAQINREQK
jgi:uncharacterized protein